LDVWKTETIAIGEAIGVHDVYFVFTGENSENLFNFDYWYFTEETAEHNLLAINAYVEECKIDTVAGYNTTNITVDAIYTDGISEDVTSETSFTFNQQNIIFITDSVVTGLNYGTVTATASYNDITDSVKIVVKNLESELIVSRIYSDTNNIGLFTGSSTSIIIIAEFNDGHLEDVSEKATYDNPSPEIVSISNGVINALSEGEVNITVSYQGQIGEAKSTTIHVTVSSGTAVWLESECGEVGENWDILSDAQASNGHYVTVKPGIQSLNSAPTGSENLIVIPFSLEVEGSFSIYARLNCPTYDDDSFWIKVDNGGFSMHNGLVTSGWEWIKFNDYTLTGGEHTLTIGYREDGAKMDKIVISNYGTAPEGMGEEAENLCDLTSISDLIEIPKEYSLEQNYPNPFNPTTKIKYSIPKAGLVTLKVFNLIGEEITTLVNEEKTIGNYEVEFEASKLPSGIYFYQLRVGDFNETRKMVILR
jgi:hypothetical protein